MFSVAQKRQISEAVEKAILAIGHPEMPAEKPKFKLHIDGKESWSYADIEPNWVYDDKEPGVNPWNEAQAENCKENKELIEKMGDVLVDRLVEKLVRDLKEKKT